MNQIKTYKDLVEERNRLEILTAMYKKNLSEDWTGIKQEFKPVTNTFGFIKKFFVADKSSPLITLISGVVADRILRKILFKKADWVSRLIIPVLFKNYSSHVLGRYLSRLYYRFTKNKNAAGETE